MEAGLHHGAVITHRLDAGIERRLEARTLDRGVNADAFLGVIADIFDDIDRSRIEHSGRDAKVFDMLAAIGVGLAGRRSSR